MTMLLGKLGIKCMRHEYPPNTPILPKVYYGVGLVDAKKCTERYIEKYKELYGKDIGNAIVTIYR